MFVENSIELISPKGAIGLILPSDIATGAYNADLFSKIVFEKRLKCFFDFENSKQIFPGVHRSKRFCILALMGSTLKSGAIDFFYFGHEISDLLNKERRISLTFDELELFSPNTLAPPIFHTAADYRISKKIYEELGIFINKKNNSNIWKASIKRMLSLSDKGVDFKKNINLTDDDKKKMVRMYSGKNIFQFNHRYATYRSGDIQDVEINYLIDPTCCIETEYYIPSAELTHRIKGKIPSNWLIGYRDVTNATNERTTIASILPRVACDTNCRNIYSGIEIVKLCCLVGNLNSMPFDYFSRQKIIGLHLNAGTLEQLPILFPNKFSAITEKIIISIILELSYCSWDIKAFANDIWKEANEELKAAIQQQWAENKKATGGHKWEPPQWHEDYGKQSEEVKGCPLPPFKWDEERRAVLKAELDAIYAKLYGLTTEELRYILDPQDVYGPNFPGETFRVLKEKEIRQYGEYRTRRLVLEAWNKLNNINENVSLTTNTATNMIDLSLHQGIYSVAETAIITGFSYQKINSWFKELNRENYEGLDTKQARDISSGRISFHGLIELVVIGTLRDAGLGMKKILKARSDLHAKTQKIYPFATNNVRERLNVSGRDIIWDFGDMKVTLDGSSQANIEFITQFFRDIVFTNDIAQRLMPAKGNNKVIIDPKVGLGKPVIIEKEVPVDIVASSYNKNPQAISKIKAEFDLTEEEIMAAVAYMQ